MIDGVAMFVQTEPTGKLRGAGARATRVAGALACRPTQSMDVHLCALLPFTIAAAETSAGPEAKGGGAKAGRESTGVLSRNCCGRPIRYLRTAVFAESRRIGQGML